MFEIKIDADACKKDGLCAMTCMRAILRQEEKGTIPKIVELEKCFGCGQCVAICPHGAISHSEYPKDAVTPIRSEYIPTYDHVLELVRSRRSKRLFKETPVEKDVIEKVLDAARFAPSGHNEQSTEFVVVQDKKMMNEIGALTAKGLARMATPFQYAVGRMIFRLVYGRRGAEYVGKLAPELAGIASMYNEGKDLIFRGASALILFCADSVGGTFAGTNANLALQNATLAAEALGLGCFYLGFVVIVDERGGGISKHLSLPDSHKIYGALAMGYPRLKFKQWPERKPARITWV